MKTARIILAATLLSVAALRAQIVNDGATNTLSNVTNAIAPGERQRYFRISHAIKTNNPKGES